MLGDFILIILSMKRTLKLEESTPIKSGHMKKGKSQSEKTKLKKSSGIQAGRQKSIGIDFLHKDFFDSINDSVWIIDFDTTILEVNAAAVKILGYSREELLGMKISEIGAGLTPEQIRQLAGSIK